MTRPPFVDAFTLVSAVAIVLTMLSGLAGFETLAVVLATVAFLAAIPNAYWTMATRNYR